jgi:ABC-type lipoprotein release transport system permease subunit
MNNQGFQKEIKRNARDIGSNVVILPAQVDQFEYQASGFSEETMPQTVVDQLVEYKASLNHLIPMLEQFSEIRFQDRSVPARVVGLSASIPMPGRPKSPMQKSIPENQVQLGALLAEKLGVGRDQEATVRIAGSTFPVDRVNRNSGTWQDSVVFMDLQAAQRLFSQPGRVSRIEAIECTGEQCELTGLKSDVVLANELARITDQAALLRREKIADARETIRTISHDNLHLLNNILWLMLVLAIVALTSLNVYQRRSEIGVLLSLGFGQGRLASLFLLRSILLVAIGATLGILVAWGLADFQSKPMFVSTGSKFAIDWWETVAIGLSAVAIAALASSIPAMLAAMKNPADMIGKEH